eukprot:s783_g4.t2
MVPSRIQIKMAASEFAFPDMRLEVQKPLSADKRVSSDANRGKRKERGQIHGSVEVTKELLHLLIFAPFAKEVYEGLFDRELMLRLDGVAWRLEPHPSSSSGALASNYPKWIGTKSDFSYPLRIEFVLSRVGSAKRCKGTEGVL